MPIGEEQKPEGEYQEEADPADPMPNDAHQYSGWQGTWVHQESIDRVFLQKITRCPQQRTCTEDPANRILWAARGNERANCSECQQNQGSTQIIEPGRRIIADLQKQGTAGNNHVACPCGPCPPARYFLVHWFLLSRLTSSA